MNKKTAQLKGLIFTGHYDWDRPKISQIAKDLRKEGYKAYVVTVPKNPLSRGHHGTGYSVYVEPKWQLDQAAQEYRRDIQAYNMIRKEIIRRNEELLRKELEEAEAVQSRAVAWLSRNGYNLPTN